MQNKLTSQLQSRIAKRAKIISDIEYFFNTTTAQAKMCLPLYEIEALKRDLPIHRNSQKLDKQLLNNLIKQQRQVKRQASLINYLYDLSVELTIEQLKAGKMPNVFNNRLGL